MPGGECRSDRSGPTRLGFTNAAFKDAHPNMTHPIDHQRVSWNNKFNVGTVGRLRVKIWPGGQIKFLELLG
jgi:hypothetical protein